MIDILTDLEAFSDDLSPSPQFPVEPPDGLRHWSEIDRQETFRNLMKTVAPRAIVWANANAGKRNPRLAKKEGILGGVFDMTVAWPGGWALPEFKGYDGSGRAGSLSKSQIDFGNRLNAMGHPVACFFTPMRAVEWLRDVGCPMHNWKG